MLEQGEVEEGRMRREGRNAEEEDNEQKEFPWGRTEEKEYHNCIGFTLSSSHDWPRALHRVSISAVPRFDSAISLAPTSCTDFTVGS